MVLTELKDEPGYRELIGKLQFPPPDAVSGVTATQSSAR